MPNTHYQPDLGNTTSPNEGLSLVHSEAGVHRSCTTERLSNVGEDDFSEHSSSDGPYFIDDVEYDSLQESEEEEAVEDLSVSSEGGANAMQQELDKGKGKGVGSSVVAIYPSKEDLEHLGREDLDWALIELEDQTQWCPNVLFCQDPSPHMVFLTTVAEALPAPESPVFIITRESLPRRGYTQAGVAVLGGLNGGIRSKVWTVVLHGGQVLQKGDSGSLVVDAETKEILGHVVASNPLGEIYVSPYAAVLKQVEEEFPNSKVALPDPQDACSHVVDALNMSMPGESGIRREDTLRQAYTNADGGPLARRRLNSEEYQYWPSATKPYRLASSVNLPKSHRQADFTPASGSHYRLDLEPSTLSSSKVDSHSLKADRASTIGGSDSVSTILD
ncbi:hypothetical protein F4780DRAFT_776412 [Xylariomycetidae sp. FL0641]|nr:hypothetical protein F4780DRAFT_776412 [Xylariomycetidae sp. FL0641]